MDQQKPQDHFYLSFLTFCFLGLAVSMPYSAVMNSQDTFKDRLKDVAPAFLTHYTSVHLTSRFLFTTLVMILSGDEADPLGRLRLKQAMGIGVVSLGMISIILMFIAGKSDFTGTPLLITLLVSALATSVTSSVVEAGAYSIASAFPPMIMQSLFVGSSIASSISSLLAFLLAFLFDDKDRQTTLGRDLFTWINFASSLLIVIVAVILWFVCQQTDFYKYYREHQHHEEHPEQNEDKTQGSGLFKVFMRTGDLILFAFLMGVTNMVIWPLIPSLTVSVNEGSPTRSWWQGHLFSRIAFLLSAVFNLVGKLLPSLVFRSNIPFVPLALARFILVLAFMMGNLKMTNRRVLIEPLLANDLVYFFLIIASSMAGGYLQTVAGMHAPQRFKSGADRALATKLIVFFTYYGDLVGVLIALFVSFLMKTVLSVPA